MEEFNTITWDTGFGFTPSETNNQENESEKKNIKTELMEPKLITFEIPSSDKLTISILDPQKETDGSNSFITYLIKSNTTLDNYTKSQNEVRHRFTDFINLNNALIDEYPTSIIPPLPEKKVIESFITGDRFSQDFTERRRNLLEVYMRRIARHPVIQNSDTLRKFLEGSEVTQRQPVQTKGEANVLDEISDSLINKFSKIKTPTEAFVKSKEKLDRLEVNLQHIEKLHTNIVKQQKSLEHNLVDFANATEKLGDADIEISEIVEDFSNTLKNVSKNLEEKSNNEETKYINNIKGYLGYCQAVKDTLKSRDQKQMDYESLSEYLESYKNELEKYNKNPALVSSGITSFVSRKFDEMKGNDPKIRREERMEKLQKKIEELGPEVENSLLVKNKFDKDLVKELEYFEKFEVIDFRQYLNDYIDTQMNSYQKNKVMWDELVKKLEEKN